MSNIQIIKAPQFKYDYAIINDSQKKAVDDAVTLITENPQVGEIERSAMSEEYAYTFRNDNHLMILSYSYNATTRFLLSLKVLERFFKDK
jgi:hypothetical protein